MLGPLEAWRGEQQLSLGGQRQRSVLACLLLEPGHAVSSDRIVDTVWGGASSGWCPDDPPDLRVPPPRASRAHPGQGERRLASSPPCRAATAWRQPASTIDAVRFEELVAAGRASLADDPAAAAGLLKEALGLWRGEVLADLDVDERRRRAGRRPVGGVAERPPPSCGSRRRWLSVTTTCSGPSTTSSRGTRCASTWPRCGCSRSTGPGVRRTRWPHTEMLRQTLDDELGIQPSAEVESLHQRVLQQDPSLDLVLPEPRRTRRSRSPDSRTGRGVGGRLFAVRGGVVRSAVAAVGGGHCHRARGRVALGGRDLPRAVRRPT